MRTALESKDRYMRVSSPADLGQVFFHTEYHGRRCRSLLVLYVNDELREFETKRSLPVCLTEAETGH